MIKITRNYNIKYKQYGKKKLKSSTQQIYNPGIIYLIKNINEVYIKNLTTIYIYQIYLQLFLRICCAKKQSEGVRFC